MTPRARDGLLLVMIASVIAWAGVAFAGIDRADAGLLAQGAAGIALSVLAFVLVDDHRRRRGGRS